MGTRRIIVDVGFIQRLMRRGTLSAQPQNVPPDAKLEALLFRKRDGLIDTLWSSEMWDGPHTSLQKSEVFTPEFQMLSLDTLRENPRVIMPVVEPQEGDAT